jgi:hypothetical protein
LDTDNARPVVDIRPPNSSHAAPWVTNLAVSDAPGSVRPTVYLSTPTINCLLETMGVPVVVQVLFYSAASI